MTKEPLVPLAAFCPLLETLSELEVAPLVQNSPLSVGLGQSSQVGDYPGIIFIACHNPGVLKALQALELCEEASCDEM